MTRFFVLLIGIFIGVYRVDFAEGQGSFMITPILVLSGLFTFYYFTRCVVLGVNFPRYFYLLLILVSLLLGWDLINLNFDDLIQLKRMVLYIYLIINGIILNLAIYNYSNPIKLLKEFLFLSVAVYALFVVIQYMFFLNNLVFISGRQDFRWIQLYAYSVSRNVIRTTGGFLDANVAGYFLIFVYIILSSLKKRMRITFIDIIILISIFLTLSRTAILVIAIILFIQYILLPAREKSSSDNTKNLIISALVLGSLLILPYYALTNEKYEYVLEKRFSTEDRSANIHFSLFEYGLSLMTENLSDFVIGKGFGSAYIYTSEFFGSYKYGNFHSEILTSQIETGIVGLLLYTTIIVLPFFLKSDTSNNSNRGFNLIKLIPIVIILEGVFYQQFLFQFYWFFLLFPWFFMSSLKEPNNTEAAQLISNE